MLRLLRMRLQRAKRYDNSAVGRDLPTGRDGEARRAISLFLRFVGALRRAASFGRLGRMPECPEEVEALAFGRFLGGGRASTAVGSFVGRHGRTLF